MIEIDFEPMNEEEEQWKALSYIEDAESFNNLSPEMQFYVSGNLQITPNCFIRLLPIKSKKMFTHRCVIYAFREANVFKFQDLILQCASDIRRTKRAIMKLWSEREYERNRQDFPKHRKLFAKWFQLNYQTFVLVLKELMAYGFLIIETRKGNGIDRKKVKLTDFGKRVVALHKKSHLIF